MVLSSNDWFPMNCFKIPIRPAGIFDVDLFNGFITRLQFVRLCRTVTSRFSEASRNK